MGANESDLKGRETETKKKKERKNSLNAFLVFTCMYFVYLALAALDETARMHRTLVGGSCDARFPTLVLASRASRETQ